MYVCSCKVNKEKGMKERREWQAAGVTPMTIPIGQRGSSACVYERDTTLSTGNGQRETLSCHGRSTDSPSSDPEIVRCTTTERARGAQAVQAVQAQAGFPVGAHWTASITLALWEGVARWTWGFPLPISQLLVACPRTRLRNRVHVCHLSMYLTKGPGRISLRACQDDTRMRWLF